MADAANSNFLIGFSRLMHFFLLQSGLIVSSTKDLLKFQTNLKRIPISLFNIIKTKARDHEQIDNPFATLLYHH